MKKFISLVTCIILILTTNIMVFAEASLSDDDLYFKYSDVESDIQIERSIEDTSFKSTYNEHVEIKENPVREIEKVEVYINGEMKNVYEGKSALNYLRTNPSQQNLSINSTSSSRGSSKYGYTGNYRIIYGTKEGKSHSRKVLKTSDKIQLTASNLRDFAFNVLLSYAKPVYSQLVAVFNASSKLGGKVNMGSYETGNIIEKHDDKWSYKTYETEFITGSGRSEWSDSLKVERKEIGYREEYKLWKQSVNTYYIVDAYYGRVEVYEPYFYSDADDAMEYIMEPNVDLGFTKTVYYDGRTSSGEKLKTHHRKYKYAAKSPYKVNVETY